jgi:hypothetical protein
MSNGTLESAFTISSGALIAIEKDGFLADLVD